MAKQASEYRGARRNAARSQVWRALRDARKRIAWTRSKFDRARYAATLHMQRALARDKGEAIG